MSQRALSVDDHDAVVTKAVRRVADRLAISQRDLAKILGVSESTVSRFAHGKRLDSSAKEGELGLLLVRVFRSLDALVGGHETKARDYFHAHNTHLGGVPAERVKTVEGLIAVAQYLDAMRGKL